MSGIRTIVRDFPRAENVRRLDAGEVMIEFPHTVTVLPGGSIAVLFNDDGLVFQVELREPLVGGYWEGVAILPQDAYEVYPPGARFRSSFTVRRVSGPLEAGK